MEYFTFISCVSLGLILYAMIKVTVQLFRWTLRYKQASEFKGPHPLPFIGNAHLFIGGSEAIFNTFSELIKTYPSPVPLWFGSRETYLISTPEQLQAVLRSDKTLGRSEFMERFTEPLLGKGLLTASDTMWRVRRPLIQPSFHLKNLQLFVREFSAESVMTTKQMERHLDGPDFEVFHYLAMYALNTIYVNTIGLKLSECTGDNCYAETLEKAMAGACERMVSPWLYPDFIFYRTKLGKDIQKYIEYLRGFTDNVIQIRKKELLEGSSQPRVSKNDDDKCNPESRAITFLDHLLELQQRGETLSDQDLREEVDTLMAAGSDTTASVTSFAMLMLASHPEVQERAYHELCDIYGDDDSEELLVVPEDLPRMKYIECVIKETIRLFPLTPISPRAVKGELDIGGVTLSKGSIAVLGIIGIHRNENYWPDPLKFDPDRFVPEKVAKRHSFAYLPFGGGIRNCIGSKYAMMSVKTLLATILWKYVLKKDNIQPVKDIRLKLGLVVRPVEPISLRIQSRK